MSGARSAASSITQRWSISNAVRNTDFSSSLKPSRCCTDPSCARIDCQVSSVFSPFSSNNFCSAGLRTLNEPDSVLCV